jgi:hypothetical protein
MTARGAVEEGNGESDVRLPQLKRTQPRSAIPPGGGAAGRPGEMFHERGRSIVRLFYSHKYYTQCRTEPPLPKSLQAARSR